MNLDLIRIVLDEMRNVLDEYNYRIDAESRFLVHPRHKFAQLSDVQSLINSKRRVMALRESFLGKLMVEATGEIVIDGNLCKTHDEEKREVNAIRHAKRMDEVSEEALLHNMAKMNEIDMDNMNEIAQKLVDTELVKEDIQKIIKESSVEKYD